MSFKNLKPELQEILTKHNYTKPTEIQNKTLPITLSKRDLIGISKTGSGKTLAYILPILNSLIKKNIPLHSLILIPTRELALQINEVLLNLGEDLGLRTSLLIGGEDFNIQKISLNRKPHIIIGTPGRVSEHVFSLKQLRFIVLDETDKLIEDNFKNDILRVFKKLLKEKNLQKIENSNKNFQTFLFSATLKSDFKSLIDQILFEPQVIEIKDNVQIKESFVFIPHKFKIVYLIRFLQKYKPSSCIVFVNSSTSTRIISRCLDELKIKNKFLYGDLTQIERKETILSFRRGDFKILVATDLVSRGLDIPNVELIINFDTPDTKTYIHRIGRTSRGENIGMAISLISQYEIIAFQKIEFETHRSIPQLKDTEEEILGEEEKILELFSKVKDSCKVIRKEDADKKNKFKKKKFK